MSVTEKLKVMLEGQPASPFLFVGSGFSRRYLGLEDWEGLLSKFCGSIQPFGYYKSMANNDMPRAASLISEDFNRWWWQDHAMKESRDAFGGDVSTTSDSLKYEIARKR